MSFSVGGVYQLVNKATGTVADYSQRDHRSLIGYKSHGAANQQWEVETVNQSKNLYRIKNVKTGDFLSFNGGLSASNPLLSTPNKQEWEIRLQGSSIPQLVKIYAPNSNYLLDLTGSNAKPGTPVILYPTQNPGLNQQWKIEPAN
ncbi:carbohydrate-binding module family 13 protein [Clavulina sp. PMI_390]|nr:carbohydrate-binding module family 13 protein [Clavulina sp. PMI_390]